MAAPGGGGGGGQEDTSMNVVWATVGIMAVVIVVWVLFRAQISTAFLYLKLFEAKMLSLFAKQHFLQVQLQIYQLLPKAKTIDVQTLTLVGRWIGDWLRFPFALILIALAALVYMSNAARVFRTTYNMKTFAKSEVSNWPQISPVVGLDLIKEDIDKGKWAMALTPMQFAKRFRLIEEVTREAQEGASWRERERIEAVLKKGDAIQVFSMQLGQLWQGPDRLPPYARALFAVFAARANADSVAGQTLITQLARTCTTELDFTNVDELLKKHYETKIIQGIVNRHAYALTVLASMLEAAREDGVQASSDFLWLKPLDRRMWYMLNTVGRQTPFVEVAGVFAHWIAEKEAGRKLFVPMVEEAAKALDLALKEVVYRRDET